jgi:hypothetical protein
LSAPVSYDTAVIDVTEKPVRDFSYDTAGFNLTEGG